MSDYDWSNSTVKAARRYVKSNLRLDGVRCPCCTRLAKIYKRPIYAAMAKALIMIVKASETLSESSNGWFHIEDRILDNGGPAKVSLSSLTNAGYSKLAYWGLIESQSNNSGFWRATDLGVDFVKGRATVLSHVELYDGEFLGTVGEPVTISNVLRTSFSYS